MVPANINDSQGLLSFEIFKWCKKSYKNIFFISTASSYFYIGSFSLPYVRLSSFTSRFLEEITRWAQEVFICKSQKCFSHITTLKNNQFKSLSPIIFSVTFKFLFQANSPFIFSLYSYFYLRRSLHIHGLCFFFLGSTALSLIAAAIKFTIPSVKEWSSRMALEIIRMKQTISYRLRLILFSIFRNCNIILSEPY